MLDVGVTAVAFLAAGLSLDHGLSIVLVGFVSALPDLDVLDAVLPGKARRRWFPSHWSRFPHGSAPPALGIPLQVLLMLASLAAIVAGAE